MLDPDIPSAARRVAEDVHLGFYREIAAVHADLITLLPVLDAVSVGQDDEARIERWARELCRLDDMNPDQMMSSGKGLWWTAYRDDAAGIISLADAERAAEASTDFAKACAEIDRRADEIRASVSAKRVDFRAAVREPKGRFKL